MSSDTTAGSTTTTGGSGPTVTVPTPIFLECGRELTATIALAILIAGHHAPATHPLIGVGVATARAGLHAANWLKVTGLQHVPVYAPKDEDAPDAGDAAAAAAVVPTDANEGSKFIGARYPPLNAHAIHHESYLVAFREYVTKKAHPILIVFLSTHAAESQREADLLAELRNGATESGQSLLAGAPIFARDHHTTIASSSAQRVDLLTAVMLALPTLPTTPTPFSELLQDVMADVASDSLAQLLRAIVGGGGGGGGGGTNDLQAIVTAAIQAANEKSHINKARKSKAPPQKPLRPDQVLSAALAAAAAGTAPTVVADTSVVRKKRGGGVGGKAGRKNWSEDSLDVLLNVVAGRLPRSMSAWDNCATAFNAALGPNEVKRTGEQMKQKFGTLHREQVRASNPTLLKVVEKAKMIKQQIDQRIAVGESPLPSAAPVAAAATAGLPSPPRLPTAGNEPNDDDDDEEEFLSSDDPDLTQATSSAAETSLASTPTRVKRRRNDDVQKLIELFTEQSKRDIESRIAMQAALTTMAQSIALLAQQQNRPNP